MIERKWHKVVDAHLLPDHQAQVLKAVLLQRHSAQTVNVSDEAAIVHGRPPRDAFKLVQRLLGNGACAVRHNTNAHLPRGQVQMEDRITPRVSQAAKSTAGLPRRSLG